MAKTKAVKLKVPKASHKVLFGTEAFYPGVGLAGVLLFAPKELKQTFEPGEQVAVYEYTKTIVMPGVVK
jgi:hypothetical protein